MSASYPELLEISIVPQTRDTADSELDDFVAPDSVDNSDMPFTSNALRTSPVDLNNPCAMALGFSSAFNELAERQRVHGIRSRFRTVYIRQDKRMLTIFRLTRIK